MTKEIPHADLIRALLDGKVVQWRQPDGQWAEPQPCHAICQIAGHMRDNEWRIKPEPLVRHVVVSNSRGHELAVCGYDSLERALHVTARNPGSKVLRMEFDPDTLEVISATTEAP